jgi:hypothetical protein
MTMPLWIRTLIDAITVRDFLVFGGLALLTTGAGMVYLPAAPIVAGLALLGLGIYGVPKWA